ncbi:hypothetical protein LZ31DRAFT_589640 [Colletotrichum somersetense]|nr:hypothetical protein LZ31DRAFT_589640 [Colletotrichum somersetense]
MADLNTTSTSEPTTKEIILDEITEEGFKTPADADYAAAHLNMACQKWNDLDGYKNGVLASAFFPNPNELSNMMVYNKAFPMPKWKENMWKIFTHELGHVLGLRHEFALDLDTETGKPREDIKALQLGPSNINSVMTYRRTNPPEIQDTDFQSIRAFYALRGDDKGSAPKVGSTPVEDYYPM